MSAERPISLPVPRLFAAMPVTALASILHRVSGVALFVGALFLCYLLDLALEGEAGFQRAASIVSGPFGSLALWLILVAFAYHLFAGVKHLAMDFHIGDAMAGARFGVWICLILTLAVAVAGAVWLW